jgi:NAD(P)H-hydrate epimerase
VSYNAIMLRLTRQQVREVDRLATEQYQMPGIVLMENAARGATAVAAAMLRQFGLKSAVILAGGGNNGGDGLAIARHLHNAGYSATVALCTDPDKYGGDALVNWRIVQAMRLPCFEATFEKVAAVTRALLIDAIFGTGLTQPPRDPFPEIVAAVERSALPVLAVDLPSGLDCDRGEPLSPACIRATRTVTFVAQKAGFANPDSRAFTGRITVASIGCPPELIRQVSAVRDEQ